MSVKTMFDLSGKTIVITGGSGHLGSAMAEAFAECGGTVVLASRNQKKNSNFADQLTERYHNKNFTVELDIASEESIREMTQKVFTDIGGIDVLVNNSYFGASAPFDTMTLEQWRKGIEGSIDGVFMCTQSVLNAMLRDGRKGSIINIGSMYGVVAPHPDVYEGSCAPYFNPANYGVGKAGVIQLTKYIAAVYGEKGIRCNAISPGPFPNPEVCKNVKFVERLSAQVPLKRIGKPDDLKGIAVLLASDASAYINGQNCIVDGGWTIW